jgi:hypothetical protein
MRSVALCRQIEDKEPVIQVPVCACCGGPIKEEQPHRVERDHPVHANPADCLRYEGLNPHITPE